VADDLPVSDATDRDRALYATTSLCAHCKNGIAASVVARGDEVWMLKSCDLHGAQDIKISSDAGWFERTLQFEVTPAPPAGQHPVDKGCPFDCGPCAQHEQRIRLPVVTITSACNLDCPICYVHNKNDDAYHMSEDDFRAVVRHLKQTHGEDLDILNMTGGDPTLHPRFMDFLAIAKAEGVHRVTLCTNGIRFAHDEDLCRRLGELGARVALSFDSFEDDTDVAMQGVPLLEIKQRCLDRLEMYGVDTTLIPVMTRGYNDHEIGAILHMGLQRTNIRHLEVHTITYTGQSGKGFDRSGRMSMVEVLDAIEEQTNGLVRRDEWVPSPHAHPLCYQIAYLLLDPDGGPPIPFTRLVGREVMYEALGEHLYIEPSASLERSMRDAIDRLWMEDDEESERGLRILKSLIKQLFPTDRQLSAAEQLAISERAAKAIYVHSHMDEETWDNERIVKCCDSNCYADGTTIPVCAYNVLYREKEQQFMQQPIAWGARSGGQITFKHPALPVIS
jgi:uncharacterized radical SAM superfamily Fe-S cluster-containing enzyme